MTWTARYIAKTMRSENHQEPRFSAMARMNARIMPSAPPKLRPTKMSRPVSAASSAAVLTELIMASS